MKEKQIICSSINLPAMASKPYSLKLPSDLPRKRRLGCGRPLLDLVGRVINTTPSMINPANYTFVNGRWRAATLLTKYQTSALIRTYTSSRKPFDIAFQMMYFQSNEVRNRDMSLGLKFIFAMCLRKSNVTCDNVYLVRNPYSYEVKSKEQFRHITRLQQIQLYSILHNILPLTKQLIVMRAVLKAP